MCGIVAYLGPESAAPILLDGLKRLEYRGYDSAGLAIHDGTAIKTVRAAGKLRELEKLVSDSPLRGSVGIGHTRWATHGRPSEENAHPHVVDGVAVVHNGIIENHVELRKQLEKDGARFSSDTDTEIVAHLISGELRAGASLANAVKRALRAVRGTYAIAVLSVCEPHRRCEERVAAGHRLGPGAVGWQTSRAHSSRFMLTLDDGELATISREVPRSRRWTGTRQLISQDRSVVSRAGGEGSALHAEGDLRAARALEDTLRGRPIEHETSAATRSVSTDGGSRDQSRLSPRVRHELSRLHARMYIERLARIQTVCELASEFRGREPVIGRAIRRGREPVG